MSAAASDLDNDEGRIEHIAWGMVEKIGSGITGQLDLDDYESRRGTYIGTLGCPLNIDFFNELPFWPQNETVLDLVDRVNTLCLEP